VEQEYELQAGMLKTHTILKRVQRNNVSGKSASKMEPILVEYCLRVARIGQPLTKDQLTGLALSMIEGTTVEDKVNDWKRRFSNFNDTQELLGAGWYCGFINRNRIILNQVSARMKDINRLTQTLR
jgi:hypothetical protein